MTNWVRIDDFNVSWDEGSAPPLKSAVYDRRYWLSYSTATGADPFNDSVIVYQRNKSFTFLSGIMAASFSIWEDALYFGNADDTGLVYRFDTGNNDDGANITSIVDFKSYNMNQPIREKEFLTAYAGYKGEATGSFSLTYTVDREATSSSLGTVGMNEVTGYGVAKLPFPLSSIQQGYEIQYSLSKTGMDDRLRLYDLITQFEIKEER